MAIDNDQRPIEISAETRDKLVKQLHLNDQEFRSPFSNKPESRMGLLMDDDGEEDNSRLLTMNLTKELFEYLVERSPKNAEIMLNWIESSDRVDPDSSSAFMTGSALVLAAFKTEDPIFMPKFVQVPPIEVVEGLPDIRDLPGDKLVHIVRGKIKFPRYQNNLEEIIDKASIMTMGSMVGINTSVRRGALGTYHMIDHIWPFLPQGNGPKPDDISGLLR
jgi:hypothetical protein